MDGELKGRLKAIFEKLKLWAAMNKPKTAKLDEMWDAIALFYAGPGPERADAAAGAADDMRGHLLLLTSMCVAYKLTYKQVGLTKYKLLATIDLAELERVLLEARAHQAHQNRLLSLVADLPA